MLRLVFFAIALSLSIPSFANTGVFVTSQWNCNSNVWLKDVKYLQFAQDESNHHRVLISTCDYGDDCEGRKYFEWQNVNQLRSEALAIYESNEYIFNIDFTASPRQITITTRDPNSNLNCSALF